MTSKRTASSADLDEPMDKLPDTKQTLFFVYATSDRCFSICVDKLMSKAPQSYFGLLWALRNQATGEGESQSNPLRVSVPEWFVQAVADWAQPMAPPHVVFVGVPDDVVREQLDAVGWSSTKEGDLPVNIKELSHVNPLHTDLCTGIVECDLFSMLPGRIIAQMGSIRNVADKNVFLFLPGTPSVYRIPPGVMPTAIYHIETQLWNDIIDACGMDKAAACEIRYESYIMRENALQVMQVVKNHKVEYRLLDYILLDIYAAKSA